MDVGLTKNFSLPGNDRVMLRAEMYNVFNRRQWAFPSNDFASTTFGRITSQFNTARALQVHVRYTF